MSNDQTAQAGPKIPAAHLAQLERIDRSYWWHRVRWRIVRRSLRQFGGGAFQCYYDIGSGGGGLPALLQRDFSFHAIHLFDQHELETAKLRNGMQQHIVDLEQCDWRKWPRPDVATCLDVLEHLQEPERLLRGLAEASGPQRPLLLIMVPAMSALWSNWDEAAGHHRRYSRMSLCRLLEDSGWRVKQCRYMFHGSVLPLLVRRWMRRRDQPLVFPEVSDWLNRWLELAFWWEYLATGWCRLPFGSSLVAVAQ